MVRLAEYSRDCLKALRDETGIRYDERSLGTLVGETFEDRPQILGVEPRDRDAGEGRARERPGLAGAHRSHDPHDDEREDDGDHTYISVKFPLHDETGRAYGVCGISTDITTSTTFSLCTTRCCSSVSATTICRVFVSITSPVEG